MECRPIACLLPDEIIKEPPSRASTRGLGCTSEAKGTLPFEEAVITQLQVIDRKLEHLQDLKLTLASMEARLREETAAAMKRHESKLRNLLVSMSSETLPTEARYRHPRLNRAPTGGFVQRSLPLDKTKSTASADYPLSSQAEYIRLSNASPLQPKVDEETVHSQSFVTLLTTLATASYTGRPVPPRRLSTSGTNISAPSAVANSAGPASRPSAQHSSTAPSSSSARLGQQGSARSSLVQHPDMGRMLARLKGTRTTVQVWNFLESPESSELARWYVRLMICLILTSVVVTFMQTLSPPVLKGSAAGVAELAFDAVFVLELGVRFAVCPDRLVFFRSIFNVIDLLASLPLFLRLTGNLDLTQDEESTEFAVLVGAVPVFRLLKILRHFEKFHLLLSAFAIAFEALPVLLFTLIIIVMICSFMIYVSEPRSSIESLPFAMWFTIVTMTTVGYGDIVPETPVGYGVTVVLIIGSVLYMAIPIGIVGNAFSRVWEDRDRLLLVQRTRDCLLKGGYRAQDIPGLFAIFDRHHSGELSFSSFRRMLAAMKIGLTQDRIVRLFYSFDSNSNGTISAEEFVRILFPEAHAEMYRPAMYSLPAGSTLDELDARELSQEEDAPMSETMEPMSGPASEMEP